MANNCENRVEIYGDVENLKNLHEKLKAVDFLHFDTYSTLFEYSNEDYNWGSKWQQLEVEYYEGEDNMSIYGDSAWGPATGLWEKISKDYNCTVDLKYSEPGCDIAGTKSWSNGTLLEDVEMTYMEYLYIHDNDYFYDEIGYRSEYNTLGELILELGSVYDKLTDSEKQRVSEIHENNYQEEE